MAKKTVTESEYEIMKILWESDAPITVGEVYKRLPEAEKRWSKNTVATLLVRLCEKGAAAYNKRRLSSLLRNSRQSGLQCE